MFDHLRTCQGATIRVNRARGKPLHVAIEEEHVGGIVVNVGDFVIVAAGGSENGRPPGRANTVIAATASSGDRPTWASRT